MQFSILLKSSLFFIAFIAFASMASSAQQKIKGKSDASADSTQSLSDTLYYLKPAKNKPFKEKVYHPDSTHSPTKAVIESAILPGLGQLYNNRWWKVPLIYGGLSTLTVTMIYNHRNYERYLRIYHYYYFDPTKVPKTVPDYAYFQKLVNYGYKQEQVADAANGYDRDFQLSLLGIAALWGIQTVDAYIDAKFSHSFSMDDNLSFKISPGVISQPVYAANNKTGFMPVLKITFSL